MHAMWPGLREVERAFKLEIVRDVKEKATLFSFTALVTAGFVGVSSFGFGYVASQYSYPVAFYSAAIVLVLALLPLLVAVWRSE
jgi:hypothetical protein